MQKAKLKFENLKIIYNKLQFIFVSLIFIIFSNCAGVLNLEKESILEHLGMGKKTQNHLALLGLIPQSYPGGDSITKDIGVSGGQLELQGVKVVIPAGALDETVSITMNKVAISENTYPGMLPMASQIELSPEGLQFKKPVQLSIDILGHNLSDRLNKDFGGIFYISDPSLKKWEILETQRNEVDGKLVANLNHFSIYAPLFLNIDRIATGVETNPAIISLTGLALRDFMRFHDTSIERNGLFSFNSNYFIPFFKNLSIADPLLYATFINNPWSAIFGDNSGFSDDDWDADGIPNSTDPHPLDSTNSGDLLAPIALSYTPNILTVPQLPNQDIVVSFDERINVVSARFGVFLDDGSNLSPLFLKSVDATGTILTYTFPYFLRSDTVYTLRMHGIMDMMGNTVFPNSGIGTFRTLDSTYPRILGLTPTTNTIVPIGTSSLSISFDEPMDPTSLAGLTISGAGTPSLNFLGLTSGNTVANYSVSGLEESSTYHLNFWTSGIQDANGNPLTLTWETYSFRTVDTIPPIAVAISTPTNAVGLGTNSFQIFFNEEINPASLPNSVYLDRRNHLGTLLTSEMLNFVSLDASRKIATFSRSLPGTLVQNSYYSIRLEPGIADTSNNVTVTPRMFNFKTVDTVNPSITNYTLAGPTPTQFVDGIHFTIQFSEEMDRNTLTNAINAQIRVTNLNIFVQLHSYDPVTFVASYWIPSSAFLDGQNYTTIYGRTLDIFRNNTTPPRDLSGRAVGAFTYPVSLTNDPPEVQPLIGFLRRADITDTTAVITMNRSMDASTLSTVNFSLGYRYRLWDTNGLQMCSPNEYTGTVYDIPVYRSPLERSQCLLACDFGIGGPRCDRAICFQPIRMDPRHYPIARCRYRSSNSIKSKSKNFNFSGTYIGYGFIDSDASFASFISTISNNDLLNQIYEDRDYCIKYGNWETDCPRSQLIDSELQLHSVNTGIARDFSNIPMTWGGIQ